MVMEKESVWDYPRPPKLEQFAKAIEIVFNGQRIVYTTQAMRVLETSHPPVYYIPPSDILTQYLKPSSGSSYCEWKGAASYWDVQVGERVAPRAAWSYATPTVQFDALKDYLAFYASKMDICSVDGEIVKAQEGDFYGGWITANLVGPFKGGPGSGGW